MRFVGKESELEEEKEPTESIEEEVEKKEESDEEREGYMERRYRILEQLAPLFPDKNVINRKRKPRLKSYGMMR